MTWRWNTIIEPFKIKSVEPLGFTTAPERAKILKSAHYNVFAIPADKVMIDLLTDSGTSAMSAEQWAGIMRGDESYAGARSFFAFERAVRELTGFKHVLPAHQGRAAERILFSVVGGKGKVFLSNAHFDTTRANVEATGAEAIDLPVREAWDFDQSGPFKGNIDLEALEEAIAKHPKRVAMVIMTVTSNSLGGQPVSLENLREARRICRRHGIPLFLDAARFAENAYLIKVREPGCHEKTPKEIAREMFSLADGCLMSGKKDALVNMGGFLAMNDDDWAEKARQVLILGEGFTTYGGLAGRDLEAIAIGLEEVLHEEYLQYRIASVQYLGDALRDIPVPIVEPPGGHAVYINAKAFLSHLPPEKYPAQALVCELYLQAGIRAVEIGSLMFGRRDGRGGFVPARMELVRLAIPRRVYTQSHIDFVIEVLGRISSHRQEVRGLRLVEGPERLTHFSAKLAPV
jgi:tyrosine phenol-lyase